MTFQYNNSYEPEFRVRTGQENIADLSKFISYGGQQSTDWDIGQDIQECNGEMMNSVPTLLPPKMRKSVRETIEGVQDPKNSLIVSFEKIVKVFFLSEGALNKPFLEPEDNLRIFVSYVGR